jgi:hypothetical protein
MAYAQPPRDGRSPPDHVHEVRFKSQVSRSPSPITHCPRTLFLPSPQPGAPSNLLGSLDPGPPIANSTGGVLRAVAHLERKKQSGRAGELALVSTAHVTPHSPPDPRASIGIKPWPCTMPLSVYSLYDSWHFTSSTSFYITHTANIPVHGREHLLPTSTVTNLGPPNPELGDRHASSATGPEARHIPPSLVHLWEQPLTSLNTGISFVLEHHIQPPSTAIPSSSHALVRIDVGSTRSYGPRELR